MGPWQMFEHDEVPTGSLLFLSGMTMNFAGSKNQRSPVPGNADSRIILYSVADCI